MADIPLPPHLKPGVNPVSGETTIGLGDFPPSLAPGWHLYIEPDTGAEEWVGPDGPSNGPLFGPDARPIGWWGYDPATGKVTWHKRERPPNDAPGRWIYDEEKRTYHFVGAPASGELKVIEAPPPEPRPAGTLMTVERGWIRIVIADRGGNIGRRFGWEGPLTIEAPIEMPLAAGGRLVYLPDALTDDALDGSILRSDNPIKLDLPKLPPWAEEDDGKLIGKGPITLTPGGATASPAPPAPDAPVPAPGPLPPIVLDPFRPLPPLPPWPLWPWGGTIPEPPKPPVFGPLPLPDASDLFNPFSDGDEKLIFPKTPWLGPYQKPLDKALQEGLKEFLTTLGKGSTTTLHGKDWEDAGKAAAQKAGQELLSWLWERFQKTFFGGKLDWDSFWDFAEDHPVGTSLGVGIGLLGYGGYIGHEYSKKSKLKIDLGALKFEYDDSKKKGEWKFEFKFKFDF